jgi:hypothetical protein
MIATDQLVRARRLGWLVVAVAFVASCTGPARTAGDFRLKARNSAAQASSALSTAQLAADLVRERKTFSNYVAVVLDSAETDVSSVQDTFASIQPPDRSQDALRARLGSLLSDATDSIASMRIDARRHAWSDLLDAARSLPDLLSRLGAYVHSPA